MDTPEHTLMSCDKWEAVRRKCWKTIEFRVDGQPNIEEVMKTIVQDESKWHSFAEMCKEILLEKATEERRRERNGMDRSTMLSTDQDLESRNMERMRDI